MFYGRANKNSFFSFKRPEKRVYSLIAQYRGLRVISKHPSTVLVVLNIAMAR